MAASKRDRKIILAALSFFKDYGEAFVELIKGDKEENKKAWKILRQEIVDLRADLAEKFKKTQSKDAQG